MWTCSFSTLSPFLFKILCSLSHSLSPSLSLSALLVIS